MTLWNDHSMEHAEGVLFIEFEEGAVQPEQAFLSWSRPMSPDDPDDDAREVVMLGYANGPWDSRDAAVALCLEEAKRLLEKAGY